MHYTSVLRFTYISFPFIVIILVFFYYILIKDVAHPSRDDVWTRAEVIPFCQPIPPGQRPVPDSNADDKFSPPSDTPADTMGNEKSQNPNENLDQPSDGEHTNLSDRTVSSSSTAPRGTADPPPYSPAAESSAPARTSSSQPSKPIAIPAIGPSSDSPFIRAYAPILIDYNLPRESFFSFLDQLNNVISSSPPLQVLDATGGILQSVPLLFPLHWIGSAVSGLANLGSQGVSKSRTDSHIRQANQDIFNPRGLKVEIAKLDALAYMAHIPILDSQGKISRQTPLSQQLLTEAGRNMAADELPDGGIQQRYLKILQPWIAELELDILPWASKPKLTRFNAALKEKINTRCEPGSAACQKGESSNEETGLRKCLWLIIKPMNE